MTATRRTTKGGVESPVAAPARSESDWIETPLGEILTLNYGWSLPEKKRVAGAVPVFGSNGIVGSHHVPLVNSRGLIVGRKGSAGIVHFSRVPFCPIDTTFFISPSDTTVDLEFLFYLLLHVDLRRILGDVGVPGLNREVAYKEPASLPRSKDEQRKIAGVLGLVQRAMEQQERLIKKTAELKKTLLHQLFTQGTRGESQKQTDLGPIPESWHLVEIGSLGKIVTGSTPKTAEPANYSPSEIDFIAPADLGIAKDVTDSEKKISRQGLASIRALPSKAVLCVCIGSSIGKVGMTTKESATNQQINSIVCNESHDPDFIFHQLIYRYDYWRGFATFGTVPILNKGRFQTIKLSIPKTRTEEIEITAALNALESKLAHHRRKHATLSALFRTLLHQLMTAQLRVHDLDLRELSK